MDPNPALETKFVEGEKVNTKEPSRSVSPVKELGSVTEPMTTSNETKETSEIQPTSDEKEPTVEPLMVDQSGLANGAQREESPGGVSLLAATDSTSDPPTLIKAENPQQAHVQPVSDAVVKQEPQVTESNVPASPNQELPSISSDSDSDSDCDSDSDSESSDDSSDDPLASGSESGEDVLPGSDIATQSRQAMSRAISKLEGDGDDDGDDDDDEDDDGGGYKNREYDGPTKKGLRVDLWGKPRKPGFDEWGEPELDIIKPTITISPYDKIEQLGQVEHIVKQMITIMSFKSGAENIYDRGTHVCTEDRKVIGTIWDLTGTLHNPHGGENKPLYIVKFESQEVLDSFKLEKGSVIYYLPSNVIPAFPNGYVPKQGNDDNGEEYDLSKERQNIKLLHEENMRAFEEGRDFNEDNLPADVWRMEDQEPATQRKRGRDGANDNHGYGGAPADRASHHHRPPPRGSLHRPPPNGRPAPHQRFGGSHDFGPPRGRPISRPEYDYSSLEYGDDHVPGTGPPGNAPVMHEHNIMPPQPASRPSSSAGSMHSFGYPPVTSYAPAPGPPPFQYNGYPAPAGGFYSGPGPVNGGFHGPVNGAYHGPVNGAYHGPINGGYPGSVNGGYPGPFNGGYPGPVNGGYPGPINGGYPGPIAGHPSDQTQEAWYAHQQWIMNQQQQQQGHYPQPARSNGYNPYAAPDAGYGASHACPPHCVGQQPPPPGHGGWPGQSGERHGRR